MPSYGAHPWVLPLSNPLGEEPPALFARVANATGGTLRVDDSPSGRFFKNASDGRLFPDPARGRPQTLVPLVSAVVDELRQVYAITFDPPVRDGEVHNLDVFVTIPGQGRVRARAPSLYRAPAGR